MRMSRNRDMSYATSLSSVAAAALAQHRRRLGAYVLETPRAWTRGAAIDGGGFRPGLLGRRVRSPPCRRFVFLRLPPDAGAEMSGHRDCQGKTAFDRPRRWMSGR